MNAMRRWLEERHLCHCAALLLMGEPGGQGGIRRTAGSTLDSTVETGATAERGIQGHLAGQQLSAHLNELLLCLQLVALSVQDF